MTTSFVLPATQVKPKKYLFHCKRCCQLFCPPPPTKKSKLIRYPFYPVVLVARKPNEKQGTNPKEFQDSNSFFHNATPTIGETKTYNSEDSSSTLPPNGERAGGGRRKRKPHSIQTKKKISQSLKGRSLSNETKKKISEAMKGKQFTPSHRFAISQRMQGPLNPMYGRRMSAQTRLKISLSLRKCKLENNATVQEKRENTTNPLQVHKAMLHEKYQQIRDSLQLEMDKEGLELIGYPSQANLDKGKKRKLKMIQNNVKKRLRQVSRDIDGLELDESILLDDFVAQKLEPESEKSTSGLPSSGPTAVESNKSLQTSLSSKLKSTKHGAIHCKSCAGRGIKACEYCVKKYGVRSSKCIHCYGSGLMFCTECNGSGELLSK